MFVSNFGGENFQGGQGVDIGEALVFDSEKIKTQLVSLEISLAPDRLALMHGAWAMGDSPVKPYTSIARQETRRGYTRVHVQGVESQSEMPI
ncbi:MAG: hypothetical protein V4710_17345 [Verrucomicrobiota bacterium]